MVKNKYIHKVHSLTIWLGEKRQAAMITALLLLAAASAFASYFASKATIFNADATANTLMLADPFIRHDMLFADWHTNLLKIPVIYIQGLLPINVISYTISNAVLLFFTMLLWALAISKATNKKLFVPALLFLAFLTASTLRLPIETIFVTIRNIEFPIFFLLVVAFWSIIKDTTPTRIPKLKITLYLIFTTLLYSSDPFFIYAMVPPMLLVFALKYTTLKNLTTKHLCLYITTILLPVLLYKLLLLALKLVGIYNYHGSPLRPPIYDFFTIPKSFWQSTYDLLIIFNGDIFGKSLSPLSVINVIFFLLFLLAIWLLIKDLKNIQALAKEMPAYTTLLFSTVLIFIIYVFTFGAERQLRYLILPVLGLSTIIIRGILYTKFTKNEYLIWLVLIVTVMLMPLGALNVYKQYQRYEFFDYETSKSQVLGIIDSLKAHNVDYVIAGHSYVVPLGFWSHDKLRIAPIEDCTHNLEYLTRLSWYRPTTSSVQAIIIDPFGRDLNCSPELATSYYGTPDNQYTVNGLDGTPLTVYIYNENVAQKIQLDR